MFGEFFSLVNVLLNLGITIFKEIFLDFSIGSSPRINIFLHLPGSTHDYGEMISSFIGKVVSSQGLG